MPTWLLVEHQHICPDLGMFIAGYNIYGVWSRFF